LASPARATSQSAPKVYESKHQPSYKILLHLDWSCCRDKVHRAALLRLWLRRTKPVDSASWCGGTWL